MKLIIVGCGHIGGAMLEGWLVSHIVAEHDAHIIAPNHPLKNLGTFSKKAPLNIYHTDDITNLVKQTEFTADNSMVVLAVRPQIMKDVLPLYRPLADKNIPFMTVAAGLHEDFYRNILGDKQPIIRVMPNMPTSIGRGMNAIYYNQYCMENHKNIAEKLMCPLGEFDILSNEDEMDAFTALAGSGPAYIFLLVESMAAAAVSLGFPSENAQKIALETVLGTAEYMKDIGLDGATLRSKIALPGGTTEQALKILMQTDGLAELMQKAMSAASEHSKKMSKELAQ